MTIALIDTHCHLDFECFDKDREQVIADAHNNHVEKIIIPGTEKKFWARISNLCHKEELYACYGLHPYWVNQHKPEDIKTLKQTLTEKQCVAVGECGLDFRSGQAEKSEQLRYFEAQLALAQEMTLPVVIHAVRATETVINCLKKHPSLTGMIHSYSGSLEQAMQLIDMGFYISIGGTVTFEQARKVRNTVSNIPLSALLLETDAPDQPDILHKGRRNEPAFLTQTLKTIAELRQESPDLIARQTTFNAEKLFGI